MRLILIRHGETYANCLYGTSEQKLIGALDCELTMLNERGKEQAKEASCILSKMNENIDEIYVSDLIRTKQTADIIFPNTAYILEPRLRERSLGDLEGVLLSEVLSDPNISKDLVDVERDGVERSILVGPESGECYQDVFDRLREFLNTLDFESDRTIAIVSHFHTLRCLVYLLQRKQVNKDFFELMIRNSYPYVLQYQDGIFHFENDDLCL